MVGRAVMNLSQPGFRLRLAMSYLRLWNWRGGADRMPDGITILPDLKAADRLLLVGFRV